ncbi:unnamed protein product [Heterobilharzia americana]|nr:unnamed protein product [Heterobilharzia americana]
MNSAGELEAIPIKDTPANNDEVVIIYSNTNERRGWDKKVEFLMTCIGYAVGLGNVWRFPYLCFKNGGGAFLIPYTCPISVWNISPLFKGIGHAMVLLSWLVNVYYQIIVVHCFYYFCVSFTNTLPWTDCDPSWSSPRCVDHHNAHFTNITNPTSPSEEYYSNRVLQISSALLLLCSWGICALAVIKGVQSLGKVSYFTGLFPYVMLTILLVRGALLPGSGTGVLYYLTPDFSRYNKFKNNCCRDAVIVAVINCLTSVYAGFIIFANLGFMAYKKNTTVAAVASGGPGLAFVVYPEAITNMPFSSFWSVLFFLMMMTLGFGSQFSILETTLSGVQDELRRYGFQLTEKRKIIFRVSVCFFNFLVGLPMVCAGGYYLLTIYDTVMSGYAPLVVAFSELVVISYVYGLKQFRRDIEMMINERPNWYWRICWLLFAPFICIFLIISVLSRKLVMKENNYTFPPWSYIMYELLSCATIILIVGWFLYKYCTEGGYLLLKEFLKPIHEWGPADRSHRAEFISMIRSHESRINETVGVTIQQGPKMEGSQMKLGSGLDSSLKSDIAAAGVVDDTKFFQSKLNVAEKLTQAHTKEVVKRVVSNTDIDPAEAVAVLSASQTALTAASSAALLSMLPSTGTTTSTKSEFPNIRSVKLPEQFLLPNESQESRKEDITRKSNHFIAIKNNE